MIILATNLFLLVLISFHSSFLMTTFGSKVIFVSKKSFLSFILLIFHNFLGEIKNFFLGISVDHQKVELPIRNPSHPNNNSLISFLVKESTLYSVADNMIEGWKLTEKGLVTEECILFKSAPKSVALIDGDLFVGNSEVGSLHIYENHSRDSSLPSSSSSSFSSSHRNIPLPLLKQSEQNIRHISFFDIQGITFVFLAGRNKICILRKEKK